MCIAYVGKHKTVSNADKTQRGGAPHQVLFSLFRQSAPISAAKLTVGITVEALGIEHSTR
jgi:hypothetical protein